MSDEEYEVEKIIGMRTTNKNTMFLVRWKGYGPEEDSWEPPVNLTNCKNLLQRFIEDHETKTRRSVSKTADEVRLRSTPSRSRTPIGRSETPSIRQTRSATKEEVIPEQFTKLKTEKEDAICNGATEVTSLRQIKKSAVAELVRSSLDISPMSLKEAVGRYPTIGEIRDYATKQSLSKFRQDDSVVDGKLERELFTKKNGRHCGYYIIVCTTMIAILAALWMLLITILKVEENEKSDSSFK